MEQIEIMIGTTEQREMMIGTMSREKYGQKQLNRKKI